MNTTVDLQGRRVVSKHTSDRKGRSCGYMERMGSAGIYGLGAMGNKDDYYL